MSRYRVKDYRIELLPSSSAVLIFFNKPAGLKYDFAAATAAAAKDYLAQSLRVAIDETANVALCHSMGKERFVSGGLATGVHPAESQYDLVIALLIPNFNVLTSSSSDTTRIAYRTEPDVTGSYENKEIKVTDAITLEFDFGDEPTAVMPAIETAQENIMGGKIPIDCGASIPGCEFSGCQDIINEETITEVNTFALPSDFGVGSIVKAGSLVDTDYYFVAKTISTPTISQPQGEGTPYELSGITEWLSVESGKVYICTAVEPISYTTGAETINGVLYLYDLYAEEAVSNRKLLSEYQKSAGSMIPATSAEYAAFKTHMQSEIASILTPIEEEENE